MTAAQRNRHAGPAQRPSRNDLAGRRNRCARSKDTAAHVPVRDGQNRAVDPQHVRRPPEIWAGSIGDWTAVTKGQRERSPMWGKTKEHRVDNDGFTDAGLADVSRATIDPRPEYPMVVFVHGGPASVQEAVRGRPRSTTFAAFEPGIFCLLSQSARQLWTGRGVHTRQRQGFRLRRPARHPGAASTRCSRTRPIDPDRLGHHRLELRRLHDHVGRHADQPLPCGGGGRRHRRLAELLRRELDRPVDDPVSSARRFTTTPRCTRKVRRSLTSRT